MNTLETKLIFFNTIRTQTHTHVKRAFIMAHVIYNDTSTAIDNKIKMWFKQN